MKKVIINFIMAIVTFLVFLIFIIIGFILYNYFTNNNFTNQIKDFVTDMTDYSDYDRNQDINNEVIELVSDNFESSNNISEENNINQKNYSFYSQLENEAKIIYDVLEKNKENMKTGNYKINFGSTFSNLLNQNNGDKLLGDYYQSAIEAYTYDNPDVFYLQLNKMFLNIETTTKGSNVSYSVSINSGNYDNYLVDSFNSEAKIKYALEQINKVSKDILTNKKNDDYSNIKMIHDYLIQNIEYDSTLAEENIYNIYGALVNKKSVCEGYAKAFKYLADVLDIPCTIVTGIATNSKGNTESHAWNYVRLNGKWYAVDCTWDDPIIIGGGILSKSSKYKYFLKGENEFSKTHMPTGQFSNNGKIFSYPILSDNSFNN